MVKLFFKVKLCINCFRVKKYRNKNFMSTTVYVCISIAKLRHFGSFSSIFPSMYISWCLAKWSLFTGMYTSIPASDRSNTLHVYIPQRVGLVSISHAGKSSHYWPGYFGDKLQGKSNRCECNFLKNITEISPIEILPLNPV